MKILRKILKLLLGKPATEESVKQSDLVNIPKSDARDLVRQLILDSLALTQIPHLSTLVGTAISAPIEKRVFVWRSSVVEAILELQRTRPADINVEELAQNEEFGTTVLRATNVVMSTHRKEKHDMLRNAVLNSALPDAPVDDERTVFLNFIDQLSPTHAIILKTFSQPVVSDGLGFSLEDSDWKSNVGVGFLFDFVQNVTPETELDYNFFILVLSDLHNRDLISNTHQERHSLARFSHWPELTALGCRFLKFIESPFDD